MKKLTYLGSSLTEAEYNLAMAKLDLPENKELSLRYHSECGEAGYDVATTGEFDTELVRL